MAIEYRDPDYEGDLTEAQRSDRRTTYLMAVCITIVAGSTTNYEMNDAVAGTIPAIGRVLVALLGLAASALLTHKPSLGWRVAMTWALIQVPFFAWSPDGSPTTQAITIPLTYTFSETVNGQVTSYFSIGLNVAGALVAFWLHAWRDIVDRESERRQIALVQASPQPSPASSKATGEGSHVGL